MSLEGTFCNRSGSSTPGRGRDEQDWHYEGRLNGPAVIGCSKRREGVEKTGCLDQRRLGCWQKELKHDKNSKADVGNGREELGDGRLRRPGLRDLKSGGSRTNQAPSGSEAPPGRAPRTDLRWCPHGRMRLCKMSGLARMALSKAGRVKVGGHRITQAMSRSVAPCCQVVNARPWQQLRGCEGSRSLTPRPLKGK